MLFKHLEMLKSKRVILASGSPRRKEILESISLNIEVTPSKFEENLNVSDFPTIPDYIMETANGKASEVASSLVATTTTEPELIIAADTMVVLDGKLMGKPGSNQVATSMLKSLSGRTHTVYTGVSLLWPKTSTKVNFCEETTVTFGSLSDEIIQGYVDTNEPLDKAGGYGIQGLGGSLIESISGDYYTVMGLPLHKFCYHVNHYYNSIK